MKITKTMLLGDIVSKHPEAVDIMIQRGLHCIGCHVAYWETLEQGAKAHGMSDKDINEMLKEMNGATTKTTAKVKIIKKETVKKK